MRMLLGSLALALGLSALANNITISGGQLTGNTGTQVLVQVDVSWQNSWRINPDRWDAAWVFVKYRTVAAGWQHALLDATGHVAPAGTAITTGLLDPGVAYNATTNPGIGAFVYRDADGSGAFTADGVQLRWNFAANGVSLADVEEVSVFAIETVHVPQAAFFVGSGGTETGSFTDGSWVSGNTIPFSVTSEAALPMGPSGGQLWGTSTTGSSTIGAIGTLPAEYPKGFRAFYCMKYEVSQQGYVDFLNTLSYTQQQLRTTNAPDSPAGTAAFSNNNRNSIDIRVPGVASAAPAIYACDLNANGLFDEVDDGADLACTQLAWADLAAYLDWSGLRPMTELEYEKACRGDGAPVPNEHPWGSAAMVGTPYTLGNAGTAQEGIASNYATTVGNALVTTTVAGINGPVRVGIFAAHPDNSGRVSTGAGRYGAMELAGNVWERCISAATPAGRAYAGTHGNGALAPGGEHDAATWPVPTEGIGFRGSAWGNSPLDARTSHRASASSTSSIRQNIFGGRGVRSAP
jgi:formylglycine-generating enzyme required for sulfatase activity